MVVNRRFLYFLFRMTNKIRPKIKSLHQIPRGVLAINVNKSIYLPGEEAYLQMAALRDDGHTICDAGLRLQIKNPKSKTQILSTEDGTIKYKRLPKFYFQIWVIKKQKVF